MFSSSALFSNESLCCVDLLLISITKALCYSVNKSLISKTDLNSFSDSFKHNHQRLKLAQ